MLYFPWLLVSLITGRTGALITWLIISYSLFLSFNLGLLIYIDNIDLKHIISLSSFYLLNTLIENFRRLHIFLIMETGFPINIISYMEKHNVTVFHLSMTPADA